MKYFVLLIFVGAFAFFHGFIAPEITVKSDISFQKATYYKAMSLNYNTLISSMLWVRSMIAYGEELRKKQRNSRMDNGLVLAELDPGFKKIYHWFPAIPLGSLEGASYQDFKEIDTFMTIGMTSNDDPAINYSAALNHIGYNRNLNDDQKREFYQIAAGFLKPIISHPKSAPLVVPIYSYLKKGGHFRSGIPPEEEVEFITSMMLSTSQKIDRKSLLFRLEELGYHDAALNLKLKYTKILQKKKAQCCGYLGDDLAIAYGF